MLRSDPSLSSANLGANLEVVLRNGSVLNASVPIPPGSMLNPAGDSELTTKFVALSEAVLGNVRRGQSRSFSPSIWRPILGPSLTRFARYRDKATAR
jgi:hypothetical protein